jgi:hypothetical protein
MKEKLENVLGFILFILIFMILLPFFMISGAIVRPIRYLKYVSANVKNKKAKEYWY